MPNLNVVLSERHEALIADLVRSGEFQDANQVLEEGLRLVEADRKVDAEKEQALREAIQVGLDDIQHGRSVTLRDGAEISGHIRALGTRAAERVSSSGGH